MYHGVCGSWGQGGTKVAKGSEDRDEAHAVALLVRAKWKYASFSLFLCNFDLLIFKCIFDMHEFASFVKRKAWGIVKRNITHMEESCL